MPEFEFSYPESEWMPYDVQYSEEEARVFHSEGSARPGYRALSAMTSQQEERFIQTLLSSIILDDPVTTVVVASSRVMLSAEKLSRIRLLAYLPLSAPLKPPHRKLQVPLLLLMLNDAGLPVILLCAAAASIMSCIMMHWRQVSSPSVRIISVKLNVHVYMGF